MHHVAVLDDVLLAFETHLAGILGAVLAAERDVILIGDSLGANKTLLEIRVDDAGGLRSLGAAGDRPGAGFLRADREVSYEIEQLIAGPDEAIERRLRQAHLGQELAAICGRQAGELGFDLG